MESLRKLEITMKDWFKNLPHLPQGGRTWLFENVWWIALVGTVIGVFMIIPAFLLLFGVGAVVSVIAGPLVSAFGGLFFFATIVSLLFSLVTLAITGLAIMPLKEHKKKGWEYLFLVSVISVASSVVYAVLTMRLGGIVSALVGAAIGLYFLYEIREYYGATGPAKAETPKPADTTTEDTASQA